LLSATIVAFNQAGLLPAVASTSPVLSVAPWDASRPLQYHQLTALSDCCLFLKLRPPSPPPVTCSVGGALGRLSWQNIKVNVNNWFFFVHSHLIFFFIDEYVAVKIIKQASKYINETNGQRLSHPNIIKILKIEQLDDDVLILMEPWGSLNLQQLLSISIKTSWTDVLR